MRKIEGHKRKNEGHKRKFEEQKPDMSYFWKVAIKKNISFLIKICIKKVQNTIPQRGYPTRAPKLSQPFTIIGWFALQNNRNYFQILKTNIFSLNLLGASKGSLTEGTPGTPGTPGTQTIPRDPSTH